MKSCWTPTFCCSSAVAPRSIFQLIGLIGKGHFRINLSVALALEYEEVLKRRDLVPGATEDEVDGFLDYMFRMSNLVPSVHLLRPNLPDPD